MISKHKKLMTGLVMLAAFLVILAIMFSPVFNGRNGLEYMDSLYNSISKGSAYYIPAVREKIGRFMGNAVTCTLDMDTTERTKQTALLFEKSGALTAILDNKIEIKGDLVSILHNCLEDAQYMYENNGNVVADKYGYHERKVLYNWWLACKAMDKDLSRQKNFKGSAVVNLVNKKAVETAYNYYGIEPQRHTDQLGIVIFSLLFYVIYTMWYGFAIMYLFEGWGLRLSH